ncbi:hypothetical protein IAR55_005298 [Kwoniella newhampshirensis]|uniref:EXS domain-containing protein n=1 Tax=Kwoniella newhampshirensis TaxID=1651941 RepID=A0AAW0YH43_9TREE
MDIDSPPSPELINDPHSTHKHLQLPSFSASFPLPFRVLFLIGLAQLLWAINLHVLSWLGLDTSWILDLREAVDVDPPSSVVGEGGSLALDIGEEADLLVGGGGAGGRVIELSERPHPHPHFAIATTTRSLGSAISLSSEPDQMPDTPVRPRNPPSGTGRTVRPQSSKLHGPIYKLFLLYTAWCGGGWVLFRVLSGGVEEEMEKWRVVPGLLALGVGAAVVVPWRGVGERERAGMRRALKRILFPPLSAPVFFSDVILADILTSFAKVLGDMWISACQIWNGGITQGRVSQTGWANWVTLAMVSLPYMLRFRQCLLEYYQSSWTSPRPLANALKYFSAFPVIFLSAAQKAVINEIAQAKGLTVQELGEKHDRWFGEHRLFRLWLLAVCVNSMFSFWWDVEMDWGLALCEVDTWLGAKVGGKRDGTGLLGSPGLGAIRGGRRGSHELSLIERVRRLFTRPQSISHQRSPCPTPGPTFADSPPSRLGSSSTGGSTSSSTSPVSSKSLFAFGLRQTLLLPDPLVYHLFTLIDLVLRFTWSLKLSSHLHTISEIESGVFMMEALELVRRWMWVFVRVEWEGVKMGEVARFGRSGGKVVWEETKDDERE